MAKQKTLLSKENTLDCVEAAYLDGIFTEDQRAFLIWMIENFETIERDAKRFRKFQSILGNDDPIFKDCLRLLDKEIKKV